MGKDLLDLCEQYFSKRNLYCVLGIKKDATAEKVRKAYHGMAKTVHPDRVEPEEKDAANKKFNVLKRVFNIISDPIKRSGYDETGVANESQSAFVMSDDQLTDCIKKYIGSERELQDIRQAYINGSGDLKFVFNHVPFATESEKSRIIQIATDLQDEGLVPNPADMQKEKVQHKRKKRTNDPFENESKRTKRQMAIEASNIKKNN